MLEHVLTYKDYLINTVTNSRPSFGCLLDCIVELMDERMIFGKYEANNGTHDKTVISEMYILPYEQLVAFQLNSSLIARHMVLREKH